MRRLKLVRVLVFSTVYFMLYLANVMVFMLETYAGTAEASYYLQHPFEALLTALSELSRSPLLMLSLLQILACTLILGLATELVYTFLRKRFKPGS